MRQYRVQHSYRSGAYAWQSGDLVELDDAAASWVRNDSPGCIVPVDEPVPVEVVEAERQADPARDRQARAPKNRGR